MFRFYTNAWECKFWQNFAVDVSICAVHPSPYLQRATIYTEAFTSPQRLRQSIRAHHSPGLGTVGHSLDCHWNRTQGEGDITAIRTQAGTCIQQGHTCQNGHWHMQIKGQEGSKRVRERHPGPWQVWHTTRGLSARLALAQWRGARSRAAGGRDTGAAQRCRPAHPPGSGWLHGCRAQGGLITQKGHHKARGTAV